MRASSDNILSSSPVLVAGAGGFLGTAIVRSLASSGYSVRGLVRNPLGAEKVREAGGTPVLGDALDPEAVLRAMAGCRSAIHVAAAHPESAAGAEWARRVRVDGARNLAAAARVVGASRLVVGSGYWVYADRPGVLVDDSPLDPRGESQVNREAEIVGLESQLPGTFSVMVVRPGMVYGNGSWFRGMVDSIREGTYRTPDEGENHWSLVELTDAAAAFARVLESGDSGGTYLVVDDAPIRLRDLAHLIAKEVGVPAPRPVRYEELQSQVGDDVAHHLRANRAGSNRKLRALGWTPHFPDCRVGLPILLRSMVPPDPPSV